MRNDLLGMSVVLFAVLVGCEQGPRAVAIGASARPKSVKMLVDEPPEKIEECLGKVTFVYLTPMGIPASTIPDDSHVDLDLLRELALVYQHRYGIDARVVGPYEVPASVYSTQAKQVIAERVLQELGKTFVDPNEIVIGVLNEDMRIADMPQWNYGFSLRQDHMAVVSGFRMAETGWFRDPSRFRHRLRVMIGKNVGILRCGFGDSDNPKSVVYGQVLGPKDLDRMEFDLMSGRL